MISDHILLGGKTDSEGMVTLKDTFGVTHILNMAQQCPNFFPESFIYVKIPILGNDIHHSQLTFFYLLLHYQLISRSITRMLFLLL